MFVFFFLNNVYLVFSLVTLSYVWGICVFVWRLRMMFYIGTFSKQKSRKKVCSHDAPFMPVHLQTCVHALIKGGSDSF